MITLTSPWQAYAAQTPHKDDDRTLRPLASSGELTGGQVRGTTRSAGTCVAGPYSNSAAEPVTTPRTSLIRRAPMSPPST